MLAERSARRFLNALSSSSIATPSSAPIAGGIFYILTDQEKSDTLKTFFGGNIEQYKEQDKKAKEAQIKAEEEIRVAEENKNRQVEVANLNRQRVVAVESERVERERLLEVIARERDVDLNRIEKDKAVEKEKKEIADVVRSRVAVEKTVAEEEERIKDLRANMTAKRQADVKVITAEAEAQEALVKDIKAAEAQEKAAAFKAKERVLMADADLQTRYLGV